MGLEMEGNKSNQESKPASIRNFLILTGAAMIIGYIMYGVDRLSFSVVVPYVMKEFDINKAAAGLLGTVMLLAQVATIGIFTVLMSKSSKKSLWAVVSLIVFSFGTLLTFLSYSYDLLLISRLVVGLGESMFVPLLFGFMAILFPKNRGAANGAALIGFSFGGFIGPYAVGQLVHPYGWHFPFLLFAVAGFIVSLLMWLSLRKFTGSVSIQPFSVKESVHMFAEKPIYFLLGLGFLAWNFGFWAFGFWTPTFLKVNMHMPITYSATVYGIGIFLAGIGALLFGLFADAWKARRARVYIIALNGLLMAIMSLIFYKGIAGYSVATGTFFAITLGFLYGSGAPLILSFAQNTENKGRIIALTGLLQQFQFVGGTMAPYVAGHFADSYGLGNALVITIVPAYLIYVVFALVVGFKLQDTSKTQSGKVPPSPKSASKVEGN
jgi:MFS family permease